MLGMGLGHGNKETKEAKFLRLQVLQSSGETRQWKSKQMLNAS